MILSCRCRASLTATLLAALLATCGWGATTSASAQIDEPIRFEGGGRWYRTETEPWWSTERTTSATTHIDYDGDGDQDLVTVTSLLIVELLENRDGTFVLATSFPYPKPLGPSHAFTGHFNGDSILDLGFAGQTITNPSHAFVQVALGDGNGGFIPLPALQSSIDHSTSIDVAVVDVDGDGIDEMVVAHLQNTTVEIFSPTRFVSRFDFGTDTGSLPGDFKAGDINGDGFPDLIARRAQGLPIAIRLNDGSGGFPPSGARSAGPGWNQIFGLGVFDLDGDGDLDLVTTDLWGGPSVPTYLVVLLNDGTGNFGPEIRSQILNLPWTPWDMAAGDVDEDGRTDLVLAFEISRFGPSGMVTTLRGLGGGRFTTIDSYSLTTRSVELLDMTGDGQSELVGQNLIIPMDREGRLGGQEVSTAQPRGHFDSHVVDFDRNGSDDLIVVEQDTGTVEVHLSDGEGGTTRSALAATGAPVNSITTGDFDGDSWPDLIAVLVVGNNAVFSVFLNDRAGGLRPAIQTPFAFPNCSSCYFSTFVSGDVDGDGLSDLILSAYRSQEGAFAISHGDGHFTLAAFQFPTTTGDLLYEDFTGDGIEDIVHAGRIQSTLYLIPGLGGGAFASPVRHFFPVTFKDHLAAGDTDRDGDLDIVAATGEGFLHLRNDGASGIGWFSMQQRVDDIQLGVNEVFLSDLDKDGLLDLLLRNDDRKNAAYVYRNRGGSLQFVNPAVEVGLNGSSEAFSIDLGDLDGDRLDDLIVTCFYLVDDSVPFVQVYFNRSNLRDQGRAAPGDTVLLELSAGDAANRPFQILASFRGTFPGIAFGNDLFPLNNDRLLWPLILGGGGAVFTGFFGTFDSEGKAQAQIHVPSTLPFPLPVELDLAYLTKTNNPGGGDRTSNALHLVVH